MKKIKSPATFLFLSFFCIPFLLFSTEIKKETRVFAVKDKQELKMDIYSADSVFAFSQPCIVFVFGGGFKEGTRDAKPYEDYFNYFAGNGFKVVSIDYRLGMKGEKAPGLFNNRPLRNAIAMAVADLYSATGFLLQNADELNIDTSRIIISGSSAGAMTVLQADYEKQNARESAKALPNDFRYAGVIAFAGSIFSSEGLPSYTQRPAPTLFFHGSSDKLVPYGQTRFFNLGVFGSKPLAKRFKQQGYPYTFYTMENIGHDVSEYPMKEFLPEIDRFIRDFVFNRKQWMLDINLKDKLRKSDTSTNPGNYYD
ncbi:MAG: alpha/beta hydrolase [Bacteroidia bacterium]|nr:alpha/beta hydrolase [Bacteroidia bacterium]